MSRLLTEVRYSLLLTFRNPILVFMAIALPVVVMVFMVLLFGGQSGPIVLNYADYDKTSTSQAFIQALNDTGAFELKDGSGSDLPQALRDGKISVYVEVPAGFEQGLSSGNTSVGVYYDRSKATSMAAISSLRQVADGYNMQLAGTRQVVSVDAQDVASASKGYIDFVLPGMISMSILMSCVIGSVATTARYRARGVYRKLATTPLSRFEWNAARLVTQTVLLLISMAISILVAVFVFGAHPTLNLLSVVLVVIGGMLFAGLGTLIAVFIKDEEAAVNAANILIFPVMWLSGLMVPIESLPWFLQYLAAVSPLTYLNEGLRGAMITGNTPYALSCLAIVAVLGAVLSSASVVLMKWKVD